jgi:hypothetical protein
MKRFILCLAVLTVAGSAYAARPTLPEGFVLNAIDGIARQDKVDKDQWTFSTDAELKYMKTIFPSGIPLKVLASGVWTRYGLSPIKTPRCGLKSGGF